VIKQQQMAALYLRLSRDDGGDAESNSIQTQRMMLRRYAKENDFAVYSEYVDDGISGVTFERDGFKRMLADIEDGKVGTVICKDLSRLGRNNAMVAYYTEIVFPDCDVRFIAINDGIDSDKGENEIMGFKSIINEFYARDISKKIKSSKHTRALAGEFTAYLAPLGYRKSPDDKHKLIVDEEGAKIVRYIFKLAIDEGLGTWQIASRLNAEHIPTPREHFNGTGKDYFANYTPKYAPVWCASTVRQIIMNRVCLGEVVNGKSTTKSFKNKKRLAVPAEQHIIVPNMHPAIISQRDYDLAQRIIKHKYRRNNGNQENFFVGILHCVDCGSRMSFAPAPDTKFGGYFICNKYRYRAKGQTHLCTVHYLPLDYITNAVIIAIQRQARLANQRELKAYAEELAGAKSDTLEKQAQRELGKLSQRRDELEVIIRKLVEQNALGLITDERLLSLSTGYEEEQAALKARIAELQIQITEKRSQLDNAEKFLKIVRRFTQVEALDRAILNELIDRIDVHTGEGKRDKRRQLIEIHWRFIGTVEPVLCKKENQEIAY
jgi:DNA invertase Pin-like site-specific DNA recombinase